ncbi:hypothetical protein DX903_05055 [Adlercreutzia equolifaciens]|nr:hypothetical protein DX903_05055 [Adlercreutzia equolifaciens]
MNCFEKISRNAQEMDRLTKGQTSRDYYGMKQPKRRHLARNIFLLLVLVALFLLFMFWSKLHIVWLIH